jgi:general secretion pathway protein A
MLSNFQFGTQALLQSFLIGQPEFRKIMQSPQMLQLRQRVIAACHIGPMDQDETAGLHRTPAQVRRIKRLAAFRRRCLSRRSSRPAGVFPDASTRIATAFCLRVSSAVRAEFTRADVEEVATRA